MRERCTCATRRAEGWQGPHVLAAGALGPGGAKVVQQTVAHLGELDAEGRARAQALAAALTGSGSQTDLFVPAAEPTTEAVPDPT